MRGYQNKGEQEAQPWQKGRATLRVVESFAKSLKVTQCSFEITPSSKTRVSSDLYFLVTMSILYRFWDIQYSTSNNGVLFKSGLGVIQGHWKCTMW